MIAPPSAPIGAVMLCAIVFAAPAPAAVHLEFDYRYDSAGFFGPGTGARACLEAAGDFYESILADRLTAIVSTTYNRFDAIFYRPDTHEKTTLSSFSVPTNTLVVFVGRRDMPTGTLGWGGSGGYYLKYSSQLWNENAVTRGQGRIADVTGDTAVDFAPWGGSMALNRQVSWHTDLECLPEEGWCDLFSVVLHELGHVLGIGAADSWFNRVDETGQFTGAVAAAEYGGAVPLDDGASHWADGVTSRVWADGSPQEAAMTPSLEPEARMVMTDLDVAGLDDLGWDIHLLPGDANRDGVVDAADAAILAAHWLATSEVGWREGDFNRDGRVNDLDASILAANWCYEGGGAAVGEPSSIAILLAAAAWLAVGRRRRA